MVVLNIHKNDKTDNKIDSTDLTPQKKRYLIPRLKKNLIISSVIGIIIWILLSIFLYPYLSSIRKGIYTTLLIISILVLPIILIGYHTYYEMHILQNMDAHNLKQIETDIRKEEKVSERFVYAVFALGLLLYNISKELTKHDHKIFQQMYVALILCLVFGSLIPNIFVYLTFDRENIERMVMIENLNFISMAYGFDFFLLICIYPLIIFLKK